LAPSSITVTLLKLYVQEIYENFWTDFGVNGWQYLPLNSPFGI